MMHGETSTISVAVACTYTQWHTHTGRACTMKRLDVSFFLAHSQAVLQVFELQLQCWLMLGRELQLVS